MPLHKSKAKISIILVHKHFTLTSLPTDASLRRFQWSVRLVVQQTRSYVLEQLHASQE